MDNIVLLSTNTLDNNMKILQKAVANAVDNKQYDWKVARVSIDGKIEYE
jgi:hypothetical protein